MIFKRFIAVTLGVAVLLVCFSLSVAAAGGSITGVVTDPKGAAGPSRRGQGELTQAPVVADQKKRQMAEQTAIRFVTCFQEQLDFGVPFEKLAASEVGRRLRETRFLENINLSRELASSIDDAAAKRAYIAFMNFTFIRAVYDLSVAEAESKSKSGKPLHPEISNALKTSRYSEWFSDEGAVQDSLPPISTQEELQKYITALNGLAGLYKKHLPNNVFDSTTYRQNVRRVQEEFGPEFRIVRGNEDYGVKPGTPVYRINRDLFRFALVEQDGEMRILTFILGG